MSLQSGPQVLICGPQGEGKGHFVRKDFLGLVSLGKHGLDSGTVCFTTMFLGAFMC